MVCWEDDHCNMHVAPELRGEIPRELGCWVLWAVGWFMTALTNLHADIYPMSIQEVQGLSCHGNYDNQLHKDQSLLFHGTVVFCRVFFIFFSLVFYHRNDMNMNCSLSIDLIVLIILVCYVAVVPGNDSSSDVLGFVCLLLVLMRVLGLLRYSSA